MSLFSLHRADTLAAISALYTEISSWGKNWSENDPRRNCWTHITALKAALAEALDELRSAVGAVADPDEGAAVAALRAIEQRVGVVGAVWAQLQGRIDARNAPTMGAVLVAADELCWSMHRGAMTRARSLRAIPIEPPVPLVSLTPEWGAEIVKTPRVQLQATGPAARLAERLLKKLAIREIWLPIAAIQRPEMLSVLLHEIGHAVQLDLVAGEGLLSEFEEALQKGLAARPNALAWRGWATEVFADACGVAAGGLAFLPTVRSWELAAASRLEDVESLPERYPPPIVRWALIRAWAEKLKIPLRPAPPELPERRSPVLVSLLGDIPDVLVVLASALPGLGQLTLAALWPQTREMYAWNGPIARKRAQFGGEGDPPRDEDMVGARAAVIAAVLESEQRAPEIADAPLDDYVVARRRLSERMLRVLGACHGPGVRGGGAVPVTEGAGRALVGWMSELEGFSHG